MRDGSTARIVVPAGTHHSEGADGIGARCTRLTGCTASASVKGRTAAIIGASPLLALGRGSRASMALSMASVVAGGAIAALLVAALLTRPTRVV